jgi:hypothetical protein
MGDHIIPQVLLRGFSINPDVNNKKQKIMYFNGEKASVGKICNLYQKDNYYSRDVETELDRKFEQPFGVIKKNMVDTFLNKNETVYEIAKEDYYKLIKFFVIMWRRNDIQMRKLEQMTELVLVNPNIRKYMKKEFQRLSPKKMFSNHEQELREAVYKNVIYTTTNSDPTVKKSVYDYYPLIVVNKTAVHFPLHSKYASVNQYTSRDVLYPDFTIEPITKDLFVILRIKKKHGLFNSNILKIPVVNVYDEDLIKGIIKLYLLGDTDSVVVDETNLEIVQNRLKDFVGNRLDVSSPQGEETLELIFNNM